MLQQTQEPSSAKSDDEFGVVICDSCTSLSSSSNNNNKRSYKDVAFPTESNCGRKRIAFEPKLIQCSNMPTVLHTKPENKRTAIEENGPYPDKVYTTVHTIYINKKSVLFSHLGGSYRPTRSDLQGKLLVTNFQLSKEDLKPKEPSVKKRKSKKKSPFLEVSNRLKLGVDSSNLAKQDLIDKYFKGIKLPDFFVYIMRNHRKHKQSSSSNKKQQDCQCHCKNGCLPAYCINYLSQIECPTNCDCGANCQNRVFTKMDYPELICFTSGSKGIGVKCNQDLIQKGSFITEYVGEVISIEKFEKRNGGSRNSLHHYCMNMNENEIIDATYMGNIGRFINHSCAPNARTQTWVVNGQDRVGIFAIKDIVKGEEITYNYNFLIYNDETKQQVCNCGAPNCQGLIGTRIAEEEADNVSSSSSSSSYGFSDMISTSDDEEKDDEYDSDDIYMQYIDSD